MDRRFVLFLVLSFALLLGYSTLMQRLYPARRPPAASVAKQEPKAEPKKANAQKPAVKDAAKQPGKKEPAEKAPGKAEKVAPAIQAAPQPELPEQWVTLGSADPDSTKNPYRMLALAGWQKVDAAALDLGVALDAPIRLVAAVEATCYQSMSHQHTVVEEKELLATVSRLLQQPLAVAQESLRLAEEDFAVLQLQPVTKCNQSEPRLWQALGPHTMETYVQERIAQMVASEHVPSGSLLYQVPDDGEVDELLVAFQAGSGLKLTEEQKLAVRLALTQRTCLILGGAGTGKTTMLRAVIQTFEERGGTVHPVALAGRAACRITEATGHPARTLAGFLGAIRRGDLVLGDGHLVVVDESSMIDLPLAYALLTAIPPDCRVLWVGDPHQLPPIGMGVVFSAYCTPGDYRMPKVELTQVHRQAAGTGIPHLAGLIRQGQLPELPSYGGSGVGISFIEATVDDALALTVEVYGDLGGPEHCQILGAIKNGPIGTKSLNLALHKLRTVGREDWQGYSQGDPVIWLVNDYDRHLWNGTLGEVESVDSGSATVRWDGHSQPMLMAFEDLENLDLAYAVTIHKSQGSQFRRVIVPVFQTRLLDRTLIYTAITRASEQVVLLGNRAALQAAIEAPPAPRRRLTGMEVG